MFSSNDKTTEYILQNTSSGGVTVNGTLLHIACPDMAFGGVGPSGMGKYNGKHTFDTFTHERGILKRATWIDPKLLYPPYTDDKKKILSGAADGVKLPKGLILGAGAVVVAGAYYGFSKL